MLTFNLRRKLSMRNRKLFNQRRVYFVLCLLTKGSRGKHFWFLWAFNFIMFSPETLKTQISGVTSNLKLTDLLGKSRCSLNWIELASRIVIKTSKTFMNCVSVNCSLWSLHRFHENSSCDLESSSNWSPCISFPYQAKSFQSPEIHFIFHMS